MLPNRDPAGPVLRAPKTAELIASYIRGQIVRGDLAGATGRSCLRRVLVLEGQPQLGPEYDLAAVLDVQVLVYHFGDAQVT